jgi:hypothetical protein
MRKKWNDCYNCYDFREALKALCDKLDEIVGSEEYLRVFSMSLVHGDQYTGPTWEKEYNEAREILATNPKENNESS